MFEDADPSGYFDMPYDRQYRNIDKRWQYLYGAESFAAKDEEIDLQFQGKFSDKQKMQVAQDIANMRNIPSSFTIGNDGQDRKPKTKAKRQSNNDSAERIFPSGLITGGMMDVDPGTVVPALRNQMPTFMSTIIPADMVSSLCTCSRNFMWENTKGSMGCEALGMPCNQPGQRGMELL